MANAIESYLIELKKRIGSQLPNSIRDEKIQEVRHHLEASAIDLAVDGRTAEEAEQLSVRKFGSCGRVAAALLEAASPGRSRMLQGWTVAWATLSTLWMGAWLLTGLESMEMQVLSYSLPVAIVGFCVLSLASRRPRPLAILAGASISVAVVIAILSLAWLNLYRVGGTGLMPRWTEGAFREKLSRLIARADLQLTFLETGMAGIKTGNLDAVREGSMWRVPNGFGWLEGQTSQGTQSANGIPSNLVGSRAEALRGWRHEGQYAMARVREVLQREKSNLAAIEPAKRVPIVLRIRDAWDEVAPIGILWIAGLVLGNILFAWLGAFARRIRSRITRTVALR